ncbi:NADPH-dependent oxidoreductase [Streptomyces sp. AJS327]|uniref:NADPH-dependent FMN reductase n=1 Tax=Streptomyces sp. AJS327 TaxID=2545265 RepID=UPI0015DE8278|nr:NAD(P)H-dependent oxidoreductase [Streptomyces sp. AJS327]MBA0053103.1 NADPH-dependent oxidoreductase [Streptomyces sp. AJS327]
MTTTQSTPVPAQAEGSGEDRPLRLAIIVGSVREGRIGPVVSNWFVGRAEQEGTFELDLIDLADPENSLPMAFPTDLAADGELSRVYAQLSERLTAADAFVVITPEYNHSFPASLKNTIDWFKGEWEAKPVGLISYGGMAGGQRAAEHLRQVFPELHAVTVRDTLSFPMVWDRFDENGVPHDQEGTAAAAKGLLNQLEWWGDALRRARQRTPYSRMG